MPDPSAELVNAMADVVGPSHVLTDEGTKAPYETDWTRRFSGPALLVVRPASTAEVAAVVAECVGFGLAIVVQGGNTGLVGGGVPGSAGVPGGATVLMRSTATTGSYVLLKTERSAAITPGGRRCTR